MITKNTHHSICEGTIVITNTVCMLACFIGIQQLSQEFQGSIQFFQKDITIILQVQTP